jgi:hypothetical protein
MFGRLPVAVLTLDPGAETPLMMLPGPLEGFVLAGEIELKSDQSTLMTGEKFQVQPGEEFTVQNNGGAPAVVLLVLNYQTFEQFAQITYSLVCTECYPQGVSLVPISMKQDAYSRLQSGTLNIYRIVVTGEIDISSGPVELPSLKSVLFVVKGGVGISPQSVNLSSGESLEFDPESELLLASQTDEPAEVIVVKFELD